MGNKLWRIKSTEFCEIYWIKARTRSECKKILRSYLKSSSYWGTDEPQLDYVPEIFKTYSDLCDCPGLRVDDTRGDLMLSLTNPALDYIMPGEDGKRNSERSKEKRKG